MSCKTIHHDAPDQWTDPRPHRDEGTRRRKHGRIRPMKEPGPLARFLDWLKASADRA
jgi:hypothetical protein